VYYANIGTNSLILIKIIIGTKVSSTHSLIKVQHLNSRPICLKVIIRNITTIYSRLIDCDNKIHKPQDTTERSLLAMCHSLFHATSNYKCKLQYNTIQYSFNKINDKYALFESV